MSNKKISVINLNGETVQEVELPEVIFSQESNPILIKEVVVFYQQAKARAGTAKTKTRSEVSGSGAKRRPQKRSGKARMGGRNPVHHRGGSVAFGPNGAVYNPSTTKKKLKKALAILLSEKLNSNNLIIVDKLATKEPKTKEFLSAVSKINLNKKSLMIDKELNKNFFLASRNVVGFDFLLSEGINPLSIMKAKQVVLSLSALEALKERYE